MALLAPLNQAFVSAPVSKRSRTDSSRAGTFGAEAALPLIRAAYARRLFESFSVSPPALPIEIAQSIASVSGEPPKAEGSASMAW